MIRKGALTVMAATVLIVLSACVPGTVRTGQNKAHAEEVVAQVMGVRDVRATIQRSMDGFTENISTRVRVNLDAGYGVVDARALADYLVRTLWSINDTRPTTLLVVVANSDGTSLDITQGARDSGWNPIGGPPGRPLLLVYQLGEEPTKSKLGAWPGGIPSPPVGAIAPRDDAGTTKSSDQ